jgi:hypothetical protein
MEKLQRQMKAIEAAAERDYARVYARFAERTKRALAEYDREFKKETDRYDVLRAKRIHQAAAKGP